MATKSFTRTIIIDNKIAIDKINNPSNEASIISDNKKIKPRKNEAPQSIIDKILLRN